MRLVEVGLGGALGLGAGRVARALATSLPRGGDDASPVLVLGEEVARALARAEVPVLLVLAPQRARRRGKQPASVVANAQALPFTQGAVAAAVIARLDGATLAQALGECARVVRDGGAIVVTSATSALVRKPTPPEALAAALLHARLIDIEQRPAGSTLLTLGRVRSASR